MKILGLHDGSGCGYYRLTLPLGELAKHGHEVTLVNYFKEPVATALQKAGDYDLIVAERLHKYDGIGAWRRARTRDNRLVFENDDNIFDVNMVNWTAYNLYKQEDVREAVTAYSNWADMVTVTTEPLAAIFRQYNDNTVILQNCLPDLAYVPKGQPEASNRRLRVGWVGGSSHGRDVHECSSAVRRFLKRADDWDLYLGGNDYRPTFQVPLSRSHYEQWHAIVDDDAAYYNSFDFDIGLCPVRENNFAMSKSAIKAIEYGARGIPVIASDVTCYRDYVKHGHNGFLAKHESDWIKYLRLLTEDADLRWQMGQNNWHESNNYRISERWRDWELAYSSMYKEKVK